MPFCFPCAVMAVGWLGADGSSGCRSTSSSSGTGAGGCSVMQVCDVGVPPPPISPRDAVKSFLILQAFHLKKIFAK